VIDVIAAKFTDVNTDTAAIIVLLFPILVARATDVAANSASVAKPEPSPIILFIEVIALIFVVILVLLFPILVASVAESATAKSLTLTDSSN
jgi:hypothetical protein